MLFDELPHTCKIIGREYSQGELIGTKRRPVVKHTGIACWVQPASQEHISEFARREQRITHSVFFSEGNPGLATGDLIEITASTQEGDGYIGQTFKFNAGDDCTAGLGVGWMAHTENDRR